MKYHFMQSFIFVVEGAAMLNHACMYVVLKVVITCEWNS